MTYTRYHSSFLNPTFSSWSCGCRTAHFSAVLKVINTADPLARGGIAKGLTSIQALFSDLKSRSQADPKKC